MGPILCKYLKFILPNEWCDENSNDKHNDQSKADQSQSLKQIGYKNVGFHFIKFTKDENGETKTTEMPILVKDNNSFVDKKGIEIFYDGTYYCSDDKSCNLAFGNNNFVARISYKENILSILKEDYYKNLKLFLKNNTELEMLNKGELDFDAYLKKKINESIPKTSIPKTSKKSTKSTSHGGGKKRLTRLTKKRTIKNIKISKSLKF